MLSPLSEIEAELRVVRLPLRTRFRGLKHREIALVRGPEGWTEFSPFLEYAAPASAAWLRAALDYGWNAQPMAQRDQIPVNATVPAVAPRAVAAILASYHGCRTAKVKVAERGQNLIDDVERCTEVRRILGPEGRLRVDANGGWNLDQAEHAIHALAGLDLEYVEQPCARVDELTELRRRVKYLGIPIAADESVRHASDPLLVARAHAADLLVLKAQPLGGVRRALNLAAETGLPTVVSSALESSVGLAMGAALAAALPELPFDCGLGTASLLAEDVTENPLRPVEGSIVVSRVEVSESLLARHAVAPERVAWWRARVRDAYALL
ncbi:o-succinylbenzoate synthase [Rathayibacter toxicus]|uniref:o-succinylbenzoate synthase n=1 Tax=Rathayibacter toxicus TaxID=145458 RepID=UPI001C04B28C|nr:o-succinylbenzoate synthase [Rathayibacter toxicus]QWL29576.1 O-succinylbenzoate synthase [Rathayibacter toxicus]